MFKLHKRGNNGVMIFLFIVSILPLIAVNVWHATLILLYRGSSRPETISHHAVTNTNTLTAHRTIHSIISVLLIIFSVSYLFPEGYIFAGSLLIVGALSDVVEVMTLNKNTPFGPTVNDPHQIAAWLMATCYLSYGLLITKLALLNPLIVNGVWVLFLVMFINASRLKYRKFWVSQMVYFGLLAIVISIAHIVVFL